MRSKKVENSLKIIVIIIVFFYLWVTHFLGAFVLILVRH